MRRGSTIATMVLAVAAGSCVGRAKAGSTRCWIDQGAVVAAAAFGDIAGDFVIDTGAPVSLLHVTRANANGIVENTAERPLILAGERIPDLRMTVAELDAVPPVDTNIAGVIGEDVLGRYQVTIRFEPCRLILRTSNIRRRSGSGLPLTIEGGVPLVAARVSDGDQSRAEAMIVSTGRAETLVTSAALTRTPKPLSIAPVRLRAVVIAGRLFEQVPAGLADGPAGSLGTGVWRHWTAIRLDLPAGWMELK